MLMHLKDVLPPKSIPEILAALPPDGFSDGRNTAGKNARTVKNNLQIPAGAPESARATELLSQALTSSQLFWAVARPNRFVPPVFARYESGMSYGDHLDNPIMVGKTTVRTDLSCTIFLNNASDYEGGELVIHTDYGTQSLKGNAGDAVVYPSSFLHRVEPVRSGRRLVAVTWIQSTVRDHNQRRILFDLFTTARQLSEKLGQGNPLSQTIHRTHSNLVRMWAEV